MNKAIFVIKVVGASKLGYEPYKKCPDDGAFFQDDRSLTGLFLKTIGVINPLSS
jgi:hypothetical protein